MGQAEEQALVTRLAGFLDKIGQRQAELIEEVGAAVPQLPTIQSVLTAFGAIDQRMAQLEQKIVHTWDEKIEEQFKHCNPDWPFRESGIRQYRDYIHQLQLQWAMFKITALAEVSRGLWPAAQKEIDNPLRCDGCGVDLNPSVVYQPETVTCQFCGGVKQILVRPAISDYYSYTPDALGKEAALPMFKEIEELEHNWQQRTNRSPDAELQYLERRYAVEQRYWRAYAMAHAAVMGEPDPARVDALVEAKVAAFEYHTLHPNQIWRRHHGNPQHHNSQPK